MNRFVATLWRSLLCSIAALAMYSNASLAQEHIGAHDLTGDWHGEATFMLIAGAVRQDHVFAFEKQGDGFYSGTHSWKNQTDHLKSHDGKTHTHTADERFLAVVGLDGDLWVVEHEDTTVFHFRLVDERTLEFVAMEGGPHTLVGRGRLVRQ